MEVKQEISGVCCDPHTPLSHATAFQETKQRLKSAKTKQEKIEALCAFASFHGLFTNEAELRRKTLGV